MPYGYWVTLTGLAVHFCYVVLPVLFHFGVPDNFCAVRERQVASVA